MLHILFERKIESDVYKISTLQPTEFLIFIPGKDNNEDGIFEWVPSHSCVPLSPQSYEELKPIPGMINENQMTINLNETIDSFSKTVENCRNRIDCVINEFNERFNFQEEKLNRLNVDLRNFVAKKDEKTKKIGKKANKAISS